MNATGKIKHDWKHKLVHELKEYWAIVIYLSIFFGVFTNYRRLTLAHYNIIYTDYGFSLIKALILGKIILVAESLHLSRRFENRPLIFQVIYNSIVFTTCAWLFNAIETVIDGLINKMSLKQATMELINHYNSELFASALVVFFAFIPFFASRELGIILGPGMMRKLFFQERSAWKLSMTENACREIHDQRDT